MESKWLRLFLYNSSQEQTSFLRTTNPNQIILSREDNVIQETLYK